MKKFLRNGWLLLALLSLVSAACAASTTTITESTSSTLEPTPAPAASGDIDEEVEPEIAPTDTTAEAADESPAPASEESTDEESPGDRGDVPLVAGDVPAGTAEVRLIDAGAEPRTELRLAIAATCGEVLTMTQVQELVQSLDDTAIPSAGPVGNVMELATSAVRSGENYEIRSEVISAMAAPGTPDAMAASLDLELGKLVGLASFATISDRGVQVPGSARVEGAEALGAFASMAESLNQTQSPLPLEAVGVGARWETISVIELQGLLVANIVETELVAIDGTIIELKLTGSQEVEIGSEMDMEGLTAEVVQWDSSTTGTTTIDLATISPITSSATTVGVQQLRFGAGSGGGLLAQEISSDLTATSAPDDGCTGRTLRG